MIIYHARQFVKMAYRHRRHIRLGSVARNASAWAKSLRDGCSPMDDRKIWIVFDAERRLNTILRSGMRVLEYGAGGSTLYFLDRGCRVWTVEHDPGWLEAVTDRVGGGAERWSPIVCEPEDPHQIAENANGEYRSMFPGYERRSFQRYASSADAFPDDFFDVVLVDGRARVECARHARPKIASGGWLLLDNSERERYQPIHTLMKAANWQRSHFFGLGPYTTKEMWATTIWRRP